MPLTRRAVTFDVEFPDALDPGWSGVVTARYDRDLVATDGGFIPAHVAQFPVTTFTAKPGLWLVAADDSILTPGSRGAALLVDVEWTHAGDPRRQVRSRWVKTVTASATRFSQLPDATPVPPQFVDAAALAARLAAIEAQSAQIKANADAINALSTRVDSTGIRVGTPTLGAEWKTATSAGYARLIRSNRTVFCSLRLNPQGGLVGAARSGAGSEIFVAPVGFRPRSTDVVLPPARNGGANWAYNQNRADQFIYVGGPGAAGNFTATETIIYAETAWLTDDA